ncbi:hypothetical protein [Asanoa ishikariensis]|nr:hypothetical protein [Asanoa ishikariensis]
MAAAVAFVGGCADGPGPTPRQEAGSGAESSVEALDKVRGAAATMMRTSFAYRETFGSDDRSFIEGVVHRPSQGTTMKMSLTVEDAGTSVTDHVRIGVAGWGRVYTEFDNMEMPVPPWNELPAATLAEPLLRNVSGGAFLVGEKLFAGVRDVRETAPGTYTGIIDITGFPGVGLMDPRLTGKLGERAKTVPLTVSLDAAGRITGIVFDVPEHPMVVAFSDFDDVPAPTRPKT